MSPDRTAAERVERYRRKQREGLEFRVQHHLLMLGHIGMAPIIELLSNASLQDLEKALEAVRGRRLQGGVSRS